MNNFILVTQWAGHYCGAGFCIVRWRGGRKGEGVGEKELAGERERSDSGVAGSRAVQARDRQGMASEWLGDATVGNHGPRVFSWMPPRRYGKILRGVGRRG